MKSFSGVLVAYVLLWAACATTVSPSGGPAIENVKFSPPAGSVMTLGSGGEITFRVNRGNFAAVVVGFVWVRDDGAERLDLCERMTVPIGTFGLGAGMVPGGGKTLYGFAKGHTINASVILAQFASITEEYNQPCVLSSLGSDWNPLSFSGVNWTKVNDKADVGTNWNVQ